MGVTVRHPIATIITHYVYPPIPDRSFDWSAVRDGYEPGCPIGRGPTKAEAIQDLLDTESDNLEWSSSHARDHGDMT